MTEIVKTFDVALGIVCVIVCLTNWAWAARCQFACDLTWLGKLNGRTSFENQS